MDFTWILDYPILHLKPLDMSSRSRKHIFNPTRYSQTNGRNTQIPTENYYLLNRWVNSRTQYHLVSNTLTCTVASTCTLYTFILFPILSRSYTIKDRLYGNVLPCIPKASSTLVDREIKLAEPVMSHYNALGVTLGLQYVCNGPKMRRNIVDVTQFVLVFEFLELYLKWFQDYFLRY